MPKFILLMALVATVAFAAPAQVVPPAQVPAAVRDAFRAKFPNAKAATWSQTDDGQYAATFRRRSGPTTVLISPAGQLAATKVNLSPARLPAQVRTTLAREYAEYQVTAAAVCISATGIKTYEVEVSIDGSQHPVVFRADGSRVKNKRIKR